MDLLTSKYMKYLRLVEKIKLEKKLAQI